MSSHFDSEQVEDCLKHIQSSNEVWQGEILRLPIEISDSFGNSVEQPLVAIFLDCWSGLVTGLHLSLSNFSNEQVLAIALRHAILPKRLNDDSAYLWPACGLPKALMLDEKFSSKLLNLCDKLEIECLPASASQMQEGGEFLAHSFMCYLDNLLKSQEINRSQSIDRLSFLELEQTIFHYVIEEYNQQSYSEKSYLTRTQRWEVGLRGIPPDVPSERSLDVCLPRSSLRLIGRKGLVRFAGQTYRDEVLVSHVGEQVSVRFNPQNITTILVFQQQEDEDILLTRACILNFQEERLSLEDAKAMQRAKRRRLKAHRSID